MNAICTVYVSFASSIVKVRSCNLFLKSSKLLQCVCSGPLELDGYIIDSAFQVGAVSDLSSKMNCEIRPATMAMGI